MRHAVLTEDWSSYDIKKFINGKDKTKFICTEKWEIAFLSEKIQKHFSDKTSKEIQKAIASCCQNQTHPQNRELFVNAVITKLSEQHS